MGIKTARTETVVFLVSRFQTEGLIGSHFSIALMSRMKTLQKSQTYESERGTAF
jgi:hypothetical protein